MEKRQEHSLVGVSLSARGMSADKNCDRPAVPEQVIDEWFIEDNWEVEDPLRRAALNVRPFVSSRTCMTSKLTS